MLSVQMVVIGNEPSANCLLGACATNRNESAATPTWTQQEMADADALGRRLVQAATALKPLMPPPSPPPCAPGVHRCGIHFITD